MSLGTAPVSHAGEPPIVQPPSEAAQIEQLIHRLQQISPVRAEEVQVVRAPLRICPLGAHIDHQLGVVTGMTIDRSVLLAFVPADDGNVHLESLNFATPTRFHVKEIPAYQKGDWANYARGAVLALEQNHGLTRGLVGVIGGSMPIGGLSSSAAVTIAYLLAMEAINGVQAGANENVELSRYTENRYIGLNNGILDQSVILHSAHRHLTRIDCQSVQVDRISTPFDEAALRDKFGILVVYSGVTHALVGTDYNSRVAQCRAAATALLAHGGLPVPEDVRLRHVVPELFEQYATKLDEPLQRRARHYFGEMARVEQGVEAWQQGDLTSLGNLVNASGESSIQWYECGSPQLITLYEILRATPGVYGTRFSGAGFRGNCIALIDPAQGEAIAAAIHRTYPNAHPEVADQYNIHFCYPDGNATLLASSALQAVSHRAQG
jgi:galacturonokinase